ncbi:MAG: GNAT family N-acetyltransferase [Betaproteobacteria bacterium]
MSDFSVPAELEIAGSLAGVPPDQWNALAGPNPLLSHGFLHALHDSGAACASTGWTPRYLLLRREGRLAGALPLYLKVHSYGEYVFDWAWADAWQRAGQRYYPKLLSAVPFTPVTGSRLLALAQEDRRLLARAAVQLAGELEVSSLHCLFPTGAEAALLEDEGLMLRKSVQFHWHNQGFQSFEQFLGQMNHDKRKKVKQERRRLREAGVHFTRAVGRDISEADWHFFFRCYETTYRQHHSTPYLNLEFFLRIADAMPESLLLVTGWRDHLPLCAALDVFTPEALWGRYWGTTAFVPGLQFEACYYQAIEFCIERGIGRFEGGAQGEHKLARGLMPVTTLSAHWIADAQFRRAVRQFLARESAGVGHYVDELREHTPFRHGESQPGPGDAIAL